MPSLQSRILEHLIRRAYLFNVNIPPQEMRARAEMAGGMNRPHKGVRIQPVQAGSVPAEWLIPDGSPDDRALLYLHGGAWYIGSPSLYHRFASGLAYDCNMRALVIDYRLAPENPYPAGFSDCLSAYEWLLHEGISNERIVVAGDSAGGNLALALLVALRDAGMPMPSGAVALSPATDLAGSGQSFVTRRHLDPFFAEMDTSTIVTNYITTHDPCEPYISPLYADLHGLPPLLIHVGDHEILLDDSVRFAERAREAGVEVELVVWPGMFHVFHIWGNILPEAKRANREVVEWVRGRLEPIQRLRGGKQP